MCVAEAPCIDGTCCLDSIPAGQCQTSEGCLPNFNLTMHHSPGDFELVDNNQTEVVGRRILFPRESITITGSGGIQPPLRSLQRQSRTATLVTPIPETNITLDFPFLCGAGGAGWALRDLASSGLTASEFVRVVGVRNSSGRRIELSGSDPFAGPVVMMPGEVVHDFDGPLRNNWQAIMPVIDRSILPPPVCEPTNIQNPWPDLQVEIILACDAS